MPCWNQSQAITEKGSLGISRIWNLLASSRYHGISLWMILQQIFPLSCMNDETIQGARDCCLLIKYFLQQCKKGQILHRKISCRNLSQLCLNNMTVKQKKKKMLAKSFLSKQTLFKSNTVCVTITFSWGDVSRGPVCFGVTLVQMESLFRS